MRWRAVWPLQHCLLRNTHNSTQYTQQSSKQTEYRAGDPARHLPAPGQQGRDSRAALPGRLLFVVAVPAVRAAGRKFLEGAAVAGQTAAPRPGRVSVSGPRYSGFPFHSPLLASCPIAVQPRHHCLACLS